MRHSENIKDLAQALSKLQGKIQDVEKDGKNTFFKTPDGKPSGYASLSAVLAVARPLLAEHGLSVSQLPATVDGKPVLSTMLMHTSGQYLCADALLMVDKSTMQGLGSAVSYMRRYALTALLGITQVDDDGNDASQPESRPTAPPRPAVKPPNPTPQPTQTTQPAASKDRPAYILALVDSAKAAKLKRADLERMITARYPDATSVDALTQAQCKTLVEDIINIPPVANKPPSNPLNNHDGGNRGNP